MAIIGEQTEVYQTLIIPAGGIGYIPKNAIVVGIDGGAAESECIDLDNIESFQCYEISWAVGTDSGGGTDPWEGTDSGRIVEMGYGLTKISIDVPLDGGYDKSDFNTWFDPQNDTPLVNKISDGGGVLFKDIYQIRTTHVGDRDEYKIYFRTLPSIISSGGLYLKFTTPGFGPTYVYAETSTLCPEITSSTS